MAPVPNAATLKAVIRTTIPMVVVHRVTRFASIIMFVVCVTLVEHKRQSPPLFKVAENNFGTVETGPPSPPVI